MAKERGRDPLIWFVLGILGGIFALAVLFFLPSIKKKEEKEEPSPQMIESLPVNDSLLHFDWHYIDVNKAQKGPVEIEDLHQAWEDGLVNKDCYVWHHDMSDWTKVSDVDGLEPRLSQPEWNNYLKD